MSVAVGNHGHNLSSAHMNTDYMGPANGTNPLLEQASLPTPKKSPKPKTPKQRRLSKACPVQENSPEKAAATPPRSSVSESNINASRAHGPTSENNVRNKRKNSNTPKAVNGVASTPALKPHRSSRPEVRSGMIPHPTSGTPSQAYAGPTFHASPAASSLPIPRFFAKKLQAEETATSSEASRQESTSEESSEKSDESPTMRLSHQVSGEAARDPSPLDVFFNADRRDKARRESCTPQLGRPEQFRAGSNPDVSQTGLGPQSYSRRSTHHIRHILDNPMNDSMSKAMEDLKRPDLGALASESVHSHRSITSPSVLASDPNSEEELKRKSMSLKQLLMSPETQGPINTSRSASSSPFQGSQTPTPQRRPHPPARSASGSTPPSSFSLDGIDTPPPSLQYGRRPSYQQGRSSNSHLRRELAHDAISDGGVMPPSPTPFRTGYHPTILKNPRHNRTSANLMPLSPASPGFQQPTAMDGGLQSPKSNNELMEDTLRKILKLDVIGSDGAHGVRI